MNLCALKYCIGSTNNSSICSVGSQLGKWTRITLITDINSRYVCPNRRAQLPETLAYHFGFLTLFLFDLCRLAKGAPLLTKP